MIKLKNLIFESEIYGVLDKSITNHIKILNSLGYVTRHSCSGVQSDHDASDIRKASNAYVVFDHKLDSDKIENIKRVAKILNAEYENRDIRGFVTPKKTGWVKSSVVRFKHGIDDWDKFVNILSKIQT